MTVAGVKSNKVITEEQIIHFFKQLNVYNNNKDTIIKLIEELPKENESIKLYAFYKLLNKYSFVSMPLYKIRITLVNCIIGYKSFQNIMNRKEYYEESSFNFARSKPKEKCCDKLYRILITQSPPPYYCDYFKNTFCSNSDCIIVAIRKRFGYSCRPCKSSSLKHSLNRSSRSRSNFAFSPNKLTISPTKSSHVPPSPACSSDVTSGSIFGKSIKILPITNSKTKVSKAELSNEICNVVVV